MSLSTWSVWVNEWISEWIANKSPMLRQHAMKKRCLSFPAHVHRVSAMVIVRAITIPTLCKSIIERETYDHFSSVYVACVLDPRFLFAVVTSSFLLSLFSLPLLLFLYSQLHTRVTYAAACNQRSFSRVISFHIRFPLVVHSFSYYSLCQI
jgi:hypothetical protein